MRSAILLLFTGAMVILLSGGLAAGANDSCEEAPEEKHAEWRGSMRLGFSTFTGLIGFEAQMGHVAFSTGYPETYGMKYYFTPYGNSAFLGLFYSHYEYDDYYHVTLHERGGGAGYRWRWGKGWEVELGVTFYNYDRREEHSYYPDKEDNYYCISSTVAVGVAFLK